MKYSLTLCAASLFGFGVVSQAQELVVSVHSMLNPTSFHLNQQHDLDVRVLQTSRTGDGTTHLLINGLERFSEDAPANVVTSNYRGINASTGAPQEEGIIQLTLPAGAMESNGTSSPIVGVIARGDDWSEYNAQPADTILGGQSGLSQFSTDSNLDGVLTVSTAGGFSGTINYAAQSPTVLHLDSFTLQNNGVSRGFFASELNWNSSNRSYEGWIMTSDSYSEALYNQTFYLLRLSNIPDVDRDGIPDIADADINVELESPMGEWASDDRIGPYRGITSDWAFSTKIGFFTPGTFPWIHQAHYGWLRFETRLPSPHNHVVWYYSANYSTWFYVNERASVPGQFYRWNASAQEWIEENFMTGPDVVLPSVASSN